MIHSPDIFLDLLLLDKMSGEIKPLRQTFIKLRQTCLASPANFAHSVKPSKKGGVWKKNRGFIAFPDTCSWKGSWERMHFEKVCLFCNWVGKLLHELAMCGPNTICKFDFKISLHFHVFLFNFISQCQLSQAIKGIISTSNDMEHLNCTTKLR